MCRMLRKYLLVVLLICNEIINGILRKLKPCCYSITFYDHLLYEKGGCLSACEGSSENINFMKELLFLKGVETSVIQNERTESFYGSLTVTHTRRFTRTYIHRKKSRSHLKTTSTSKFDPSGYHINHLLLH
ncbi:hypothetical protein L6452_00538 [Arctium lappa]|uniref:Uncharacterized protein n=1 Tax=Arctium lappa TaxID=4217 RepID=A0ACB9FFH1_ARCLA|nr:hypothetical protein L6452_00538 [Arctium lappa]